MKTLIRARVTNQTEINKLRLWILSRLNDGFEEVHLEATGKACQRLLDTLADIVTLIPVKVELEFDAKVLVEDGKVKRKPVLRAIISSSE